MQGGYARVSTAEQSLAVQLDALQHQGCTKMFQEVASSAQAERQGLTAALAYMRPGDTLVCTFRTLFRTSEAILGKPPIARRGGNSRQTLTCPLTHCGYMAFSLITTSCGLGSPFLPLPGEPHGFRFPAGRTPDDNQASCLEGVQTVTDIALVSG